MPGVLDECSNDDDRTISRDGLLEDISAYFESLSLDFFHQSGRIACFLKKHQRLEHAKGEDPLGTLAAYQQGSNPIGPLGSQVQSFCCVSAQLVWNKLRRPPSTDVGGRSAFSPYRRPSNLQPEVPSSEGKSLSHQTMAEELAYPSSPRRCTCPRTRSISLDLD